MFPSTPPADDPTTRQIKAMLKLLEMAIVHESSDTMDPPEVTLDYLKEVLAQAEIDERTLETLPPSDVKESLKITFFAQKTALETLKNRYQTKIDGDDTLSSRSILRT